jgi:hypothetical protein
VLALDWMLGTFRTITLHAVFCWEAFCNEAASIERIGWVMLLCRTIRKHPVRMTDLYTCFRIDFITDLGHLHYIFFGNSYYFKLVQVYFSSSSASVYFFLALNIYTVLNIIFLISLPSK